MILDEIIKKTKDDLEKRKADFPEEWLGRSLAYNPYVPRDVLSALRASQNEPIKIAQEYEEYANAFSILTEPHWFKGDIEYITQVRRYASRPILRKDFIVDKYQILEALVYGADFILLIAKALTQNELKELLGYAHHLGLEVLVETHDASDVKKAIFAGANIIGINHRNLDDFTMDMSLCEKLIPLLPNGKIIVAESGLYQHEQLRQLSKIGVDAFLIGEHFMRQDDIKNAVKKIKEGE